MARRPSLENDLPPPNPKIITLVFCSAHTWVARRLKYRKKLWLSHGHSGLYGDDGEMQCGTCLIDFKRDSLQSIEDRVQQIAMASITTNEQLQRDLATVQEIGRLREALSLCVDRLIGLSEDGLTKIEQVALSTAQAALAQPAAPSARGRMHSCDIPECVACGNPPDIEEKQEGRDELR